MKQDLQTLSAVCGQLKGAQACRNLISKHCCYGNTFRINELLDLWADSPDCELETPWGTYLGKTGVERCYRQDGLGPRDENPEKMKGVLVFHEADTMDVKVAPDATSATATWQSPGNVTYPHSDGVCRAYWCWRRHKAQFIQENGTWKFLKMTIAPVFKAPYDQNWLAAGPEDFSEQIKTCTPDKPAQGEIWFFGKPYKEEL